MRETADGVEIMSGAAPVDPVQVRFETISYSVTGNVVVTGSGTPNNRLALYVDGRPIGRGTVRPDGRWRVILGDLEAGIYTLRVDQFDQFDQITSRAETPFQRVFPELAAEAAREAEAAAAAEAAAEAEAAGSSSADEGDGDTAATSTSSAEPATPALPTRARARRIVVQPGNNLWTIARIELGEGIRYTQIFEANAEQIRDPDLIYPGQVFRLEVSE
jgi:hypothetical protein